MRQHIAAFADHSLLAVARGIGRAVSAIGASIDLGGCPVRMGGPLPSQGSASDRKLGGDGPGKTPGAIVLMMLKRRKSS